MKILGLGGMELVIILGIVLLIFGPKHLPKLGNAIGQSVKNLRKGMTEDTVEELPEAEIAEIVEEESVEAPVRKKVVKRVAAAE